MALAVIVPPSDIGYESLIERTIESDRTSISLPMGSLSASHPMCGIICDGPRLAATVVLRPGKRVDSFRRLYQISAVRVFLGDMDVDDLVQFCSPAIRRHLEKQFQETREMTSSVEKVLMEYLKERHPSDLRSIRELIQRASEESLGLQRMSQEDRLERDAIMVAGEMYGGRHARNYLADTMPLSSDDAVPIGMRSELAVELSERDAIEHDASSSLPGGSMRRIGGVISLRDGHGSLTVFVTDRRKMETSHGVDLVYHAPDQDRFILLQYKMMRGSGVSAAYRPEGDRNFAQQMGRMASLQKAWRSRFASPGQYRLCPDPFYFKFVNQTAGKYGADSLLSGMYVSRRHLQLTLKSDVSKGPRGGRQIGWNFHDRHLNGSDFIRLFRQGWIGTYGVSTDQVRQALESCFGESVLIYACELGRMQSQFMRRRDQWGRFTEADDPLGFEE